MFTRQHYQAIADIVATIDDRPIRIDIAHKLATYFEVDSFRFKRDRFINACAIGYGPNPPKKCTSNRG